MPLDLLQIGLEHHRAGRLKQAETSYRERLAADGNDADAHHWLGVLLQQANRPAEALPLLERAVALRPDDAAFQHNLGQVYLNRRQYDAAVTALRRATELDADRPEAWLGLGLALLARGAEGDGDAAVGALEKARAGGIETPELLHHLGVSQLTAGRSDAAVESIQSAIRKEPDDPTLYYHLALAHQTRGEPKEVRKALLKAAELNPRFAKAWHGLGVLEAEAGNMPVAISMFRRAISVKDDYALAYQSLAHALRKAGQTEEADRVEQQAHWAAGEARRSSESRRNAAGSVESLERKITPSKEALELHYALAALTKVAPPTTVPPAAVSGLFDKYADHFDEHLQGKLQYRAPQLLVDALMKLNPATPMDAMDLGCGTGLCGPLLRPAARTLVGVDLSPAMIDKARERNVYDRLDVADVVQALRDAPAGYDLLISADVIIYMGDLQPVFEAATTALRPGGRFAFTVEAGSGDRYELRKNRRYTHAKPYLQHLAAMYGFAEETFDTVVLRLEAEKPVAGYLVILRRPE